MHCFTDYSGVPVSENRPNSPLIIVLIAALGADMNVSLVRPLIPQYANALGASTFEVGLIASSFAFFPLILAVFVGRLTDRIGSRLPATVGALGSVCGLLIPVFYPTLWALYASQLAIGTAHLLSMVAIQNVVGFLSTSRNRDHWFGLFALAGSLGIFAGPVLGGIMADKFSFQFAYLVAALIACASLIVALLLTDTRRSAKHRDEKQQGKISDLLHMPAMRMALITSALVLYSRDIFVAYFPLYGLHIGLSSTEIGWIIGVQAFAVVIVRFRLGHITNVLGRNRALIASIALAAASFVLVPFGNSILMLMLLSLLMGFGLGCGQPISMATAFNEAPKGRQAEVLGLRLASNRLSQLVAPVLFGAIGTVFGLAAVFYTSSVLLVTGSWAARRHYKDKECGKD